MAGPQNWRGRGLRQCHPMRAEGEVGSGLGTRRPDVVAFRPRGPQVPACSRRGVVLKHHRQVWLPLLPPDRAQQLKDVAPESVRAGASPRSSSPGLHFCRNGNFPPLLLRPGGSAALQRWCSSVLVLRVPPSSCEQALRSWHGYHLAALQNRSPLRPRKRHSLAAGTARAKRGPSWLLLAASSLG